MVDLAVVRTPDQATIEAIAAGATIPVINGMSEREHPCQTLADMLSLYELRGDLRGTVVAYVGICGAIANSLLVASALTGVALRIASPEGSDVATDLLQWATAHGATPYLTRDPREAVAAADVVYTDVWWQDRALPQVATRGLMPYQVNARLLDGASPDVVVLHQLPAHRGEEITADILEGARCLAWVQAENRVFAQEAQ